jgi:hypothetical protein
MADTRIVRKHPRVRLGAVLRVVVGLLGIIVAAHAVFRWQAGRALQSRIQALRDAGERILPGDFVPREVDARDNAAADLTAAATILDDGSEEACSISWAPTTMPTNPRAWPYLARARAWFEPALRRIGRARQRPVCEWSHDFTSPVMNNMRVPELNQVRELSNLVGAAAMLEHHDGRDDLVVLRLRQALYLAETSETTPAPVAHKVALAIGFSATERIESLAPELRLGSGGPEVGEAAPAEIRALIAALLDEHAADRGYRMSLDAERMYDLDMLDGLVRARDSDLHAIHRYLAEPFVDFQGRRLLARLSRAVNALRGAADWPTAASRLDATERAENGNAKPFGPDCYRFFRRMTREHFSALTDRRLAATALAIRLYQLDHAGQRPQRLEQLVPGYLPAIPLDAMAAGGRPIGYLPSPGRPLIYSVGQNGADDAGSEVAMADEYGEIDPWRRMDRVFYLGGHSREYIYVPRPDAGPAHSMDGLIGRPPWDPIETAPEATTDGTRDAPTAPASTQPHLR